MFCLQTASGMLCCASLSTVFAPHLFSSFLNNKEGICPVSNGEGEPVFEGVAAVVAVADPVLIDVLHGEGGGVLEGLPVGGSLNGAMTRGLHDHECDRLGLSRRQKAREEGNSVTEARGVSDGHRRSRAAKPKDIYKTKIAFSL